MILNTSGVFPCTLEEVDNSKRSETSQIDSAMARDVPGRPHAPPVDDRSAWRHS